MRASAPVRVATSGLSCAVEVEANSPGAPELSGTAPSAQERTQFFRSFACLFRAGVPIVRALEVLSEQTSDRSFQMVIQTMVTELLQGHTLTSVFSRAPNVFTSFHVRMIRVGELSGRVDDALEQLALSEERSTELNMKLRSALVYPAWTLGIALLFLIFIPPYLMDGLFEAMETSGTEMPSLTVIVSSLFSVVRHPAFQLFTVAAVSVFIYLYPRLRDNDTVRGWILTGALRFPASRRLAESIITARFARAFSTMLDAGVPPGLCLRLSGEEVGTADYKQAGVEALYRLENGVTFANCVRCIPHIRGYFHEFLMAGEETGTMADMTGRAAELAEGEVEHQLKIIVAMIEPFIMCGIGGVVAILVLASMLPMNTVLENL